MWKLNSTKNTFVIRDDFCCVYEKCILPISSMRFTCIIKHKMLMLQSNLGRMHFPTNVEDCQVLLEINDCMSVQNLLDEGPL